MKSYNKPDDLTAYDAIVEAQKIAFSPFVFQATRALLQLGILESLEKSGESGLSVGELAETCDVSPYGVSVLLDMALLAKIVWQDSEDEKFHLNKVGHFLLNDNMTKVNFNFTADVNYLGLDSLLESIVKSKPCGLKVFSETEETIYPIISKLPEEAKKSWFEFDHFYSDNSFDKAIDKIFCEFKPSVIMDIGCNTGKFAIKCLQRNPDVKMVLVDLPPQLEVAKKNLQELGLIDRVEFIGRNLLEDDLPKRDDVDLVWMSQFLDCFSAPQIENILLNIKASVQSNTRVCILELFWDCQKHEAATYCLNAISLYFTALANGKSRMYSSKEFKECLSNTQLRISEQSDDIGQGGHSLIVCTVSEDS